jgi:hypothetical protein
VVLSGEHLNAIHNAPQSRAEAAIQLEHLWDEFAQKYDVDILCGYVLNNSQRERESHIYERICEEHSADFDTLNWPHSIL